MTEALAVAFVSTTPASPDRWKAVADRDLAADGRFVFAVTTTGIYCRPTCPSRRPRREHVQFFARPSDAEQAGFRAIELEDPIEEPNEIGCALPGLVHEETLVAVQIGVGHDVQ